MDRHRAEFLSFVKEGVDILFANEVEATALFQKSKLDDVLQALRESCALAVITRSEKGSIVLADGKNYTIPVEPVAKVVDSTGAGDSYAAGFLYGYTHNLDIPACGRIASICAAEVISHLGPRPQTNLCKLVESKIGLLVKRTA